MKPDWKDAPEWAEWLAMDENGVWAWHELKPDPNYMRDTCGAWFSQGKIKDAGETPIWEETLERRPK